MSSQNNTLEIDFEFDFSLCHGNYEEIPIPTNH